MTIKKLLPRLLALPFVMIFALGFCLKMYVEWIVQFIRYGGELITHDKKDRENFMEVMVNKVIEEMDKRNQKL